MVTLRMELLGTMMMASSWPKPIRYSTSFFKVFYFSNFFQVEFRCEYSPKQVMVWVEKDTKAKEV